MIIRSEQTFIGTIEVSLLSSSSCTMIKRQSKARYIYIEVISDTLKNIYKY